MEESKESFRKPCSDIYSGKNVNVPKTNFIKNNAHLPSRPETGRKKISYIPRAKNVSMPVEKKYGFYRSDANSFMNHSCDKCVIKSRPHFVVNTTAATSLTEVPKFEPSHDFNGNVAFSARSTLCNFTASVSEISSFNQVLSFQSNPHYEISFPKPIHHKQRTAYSEHRTYTPKVPNPPNSFNPNRFFTSIPNSTIRYHCSKSFPQKFPSSESYFKISDRTSRENIAYAEKYSKYVKYATLPDTCLTKDTSVKLNDLPIFETPTFHKDSSMTCKVDYADQLKQQNFPSKKWNPVPISKDFGGSSKDSNETDKILFPALPSSHSQQTKLNSNTTSMISENSSVDNSALENVQATDENSSTLIASTSVTSTIPQASYADVIRMSVMSSETQGYAGLDCDKSAIPDPIPAANSIANCIEEKQPKDDNPQPGSSDWVISRLSQVELNNIPETGNNVTLTSSNQNGQNFVAPRPIVVSLEKPSFYNSSLQTCKNVLSALSSNTNNLPERKIEEDNIAVDYLSNIDKIAMDNNSPIGSANRSSVSSDITTSLTDTQTASIKTDSVYSSPSSVSSLGDAFKPIESKDLIIDNVLNKIIPPVIIMNNSSPDSLAEISFGIEYDEMLQLCSDSCKIEENVPLTKEHVEDSSEKNMENNSPLNTSKLSENTSKSEIETSNQNMISVKGRNLYWKDSETDYKGSNHTQLAEYFAGEWEDIQKNFIRGSSHLNGSVRYFNDSK